MDSTFITYLVLFVLILGSGYWLAGLGKPYNVLIQTVHKLIGIGAFVYLIVLAVQQHRVVPLTAGDWVSLTAAGIFFIGLIATGGLLATEKQFPAIVLLAHKVLPYLSVIATGVSLVLLVK
jgi:hypothetical protein